MSKEKLIWVIGNEYHNPDHAINPETHWKHWLPDQYRVLDLTQENINNIDMLEKLKNDQAREWGMPHAIYISFVPMDPKDCFQFFPDDDWDTYKAPFHSRVDWTNMSLKEIAVVESVLKAARSLAPTAYTINTLASNIQIPHNHMLAKNLNILKSHTMKVDLLEKQAHEITEYDYKLFAKTLLEEIN